MERKGYARINLYIPEKVYGALKARAKDNKRNVTQQIIHELQFAASFKLESSVYRKGDALVEISESKA